ncbi:uncharacterized protein LOC131875901 [Cryptomeria japonica]|uniref:uncharacterized protein LOC131875901 n=1 Tax=Cryptomeria japonica TaxID=3369 RepID=UPI0027DA2F85|nr:uncharacterized protein LOC131875901 [Cryptomeria japonica]
MEWLQLVNKIEALVVETLNGRTSKFSSKLSEMTYWDEKMRGRWSGLKIPPFLGVSNSNKKELREACKWQVPKIGWAKLNFDGSSHGNLGPIGIGCCLHDDVGRELAKLAKPKGIESNNKAKILALVEGLLLCQNMGISKLTIDGDLAIIINGLRKGFLPNWKLNVILSRALSLLKVFKKTTFNHICREGNSMTDELANAGVDGRFLS